MTALGISSRSQADGDLRGDPGDRVARGLGRQRGGPADPRVDLDDVVLEALAGSSASCTLQPPSIPSARMILSEAVRSIWYSLSVSVWHGRDDDGVAGVDAHRVEVLHVADGDAVVVGVAHHFVLDLFPARAGSARS